MSVDAVCFCQCCCDIIFAGLKKIPSLGGEEYCQSFAIRAGGGANTAMGLAQLGAGVRLITDIGGDETGNTLYKLIEQSGVDMSAVKRTKDTAVSAVLSGCDDRCFASYAGAEAFTRTEKELAEQISAARHVHTYLGYSKAFDLPRLCAEHKATLSIDVSGCEAGGSSRLKSLEGCTIFKANEPEALALTGTRKVENALSILSDICPQVIITLGANGSIVAVEGKKYLCDAPKVKVVDATGAGDLFFAGYLCAWLKGLSAWEALETAALAGALAVTQLGGAGPHFVAENIELIRKGWHCK